MNTQERKFRLFARLQELGFTYAEAAQLRRIEMTLQRWAEQECGDSNAYCSWSIERDEATSKPYRVTHYHGDPFQTGKNNVRRELIADREAGALRRLKAIVDARNARSYAHGLCVNPIAPYHQSDPRGCALYLLTLDAYPEAEKQEWRNAHPGAQWTCFPFHSKADQYYSRGLAVCA